MMESLDPESKIRKEDHNEGEVEAIPDLQCISESRPFVR